MQRKDIILIGGGGHCNSVIDVVESTRSFNIIGIVDPNLEKGEKILGYNVLGDDNEIPKLVEKTPNFLIAIGYMKNSSIKEGIYSKIKTLGGNFPVVISPLAYVSKHARIGDGTIVMHNAIVNSNSQVGKNTILNTNSLIEHDCVVGDNCHISTAAVINGSCKVGDNCFIGSNSVIRDRITISDNNIIGAGTVITKNILENGTYYGNPGRKQ